jgi:hypothetical protein
MFTPNFTRNSGLFYSLFILGGMIFGEFSSCFAFFRAHFSRAEKCWEGAGFSPGGTYFRDFVRESEFFRSLFSP